jgi:hypothetical protein
MTRDHIPPGTLADGRPCFHDGETANYCTKCWMNLYEGRKNMGQVATTTLDREAEPVRHPAPSLPRNKWLTSTRENELFVGELTRRGFAWVDRSVLREEISEFLLARIGARIGSTSDGFQARVDSTSLVSIFTYTYLERRGALVEDLTVVLFQSDEMRLSSFWLRPKSDRDLRGWMDEKERLRFFQREPQHSLFNVSDLDCSGSPEFSARYLLRGVHQEQLQALFTTEVMSHVAARGDWIVEGLATRLLVYRVGLFPAAEYWGFFEEAYGVCKLLQCAIR